MATVGDPTDPRGTKCPCKDPISVSVDVFKPILVPEYYAEVCLPPNIHPDNAYGIFSLFFSRDVLDVIMKLTNKYGHHQYLKASWKNTLVAEIRAFLGILIYCSLFSYLRHRDLWNLNIRKPIHTGLIHIISYNYFL